MNTSDRRTAILVDAPGQKRLYLDILSILFIRSKLPCRELRGTWPDSLVGPFLIKSESTIVSWVGIINR